MRKILSFLFSFFFFFSTYGQVGVNVASVDKDTESSALIINHPSGDAGGLLIPRIDVNDLFTSIPNPSQSMLITLYNFDRAGLYFFSEFNQIHFAKGWNELSYNGRENSLIHLIPEGGVVSTKIINDTIHSDKFALDNLTGEQIKDSIIGTSKLGDGAIVNRLFAQGIPIEDEMTSSLSLGENKALAWFDGTKKWDFRAIISDVDYKGIWNAQTNTPTLAARNAAHLAGQFYSVGEAGTQDLGQGLVSFGSGDLVFYTGEVWRQLPSVVLITTVHGRENRVEAENDDYSWFQVQGSISKLQEMSDVNSSASIADKEVLVYNVSNKRFEIGKTLGSAGSPINSLGIEDNSIERDKVATASITSLHMIDTSIEASRFSPISIETQDIGDEAVHFTHLDTSLTFRDRGVISYDSGLDEFEVRKPSFNQIIYAGIWDANNNLPRLVNSDPDVIPGTLYTAFNSGLQFGTVFNSGDGLIYDGVEWQKITVGDVVTNYNLRVSGANNGVLVAASGDYEWKQIDMKNSSILTVSDINSSINSAALTEGVLLTYDTALVTDAWNLKHDIGSDKLPINSSDQLSPKLISNIHLKDNSILGQNLQDGIIDNTFITGDINGTSIITGGITRPLLSTVSPVEGKKLEDKTIEEQHIADDNIDSTHISGLLSSIQYMIGSVIGDNIVDEALGSVNIPNKAVVATTRIQPNTLEISHLSTTSPLLASNVGDTAVTGISIKKNVVSTDRLVPLSISNDNIESNTFPTSIIGVNAIESDNIKSKSISKSTLRTASVSTNSFTDDVIITRNLLPNSIITDDIKNSALTSTLIKNRSVLSRNMSSNANIPSSATPSSKAVLDLNHDRKGFLLPRLTSSERLSLGGGLSTSDASLMVFDTDEGVPYRWSGVDWLPLSGVGTSSDPLPADRIQDIKDGTIIFFNGLRYRAIRYPKSGTLLWLDRNLGAIRSAAAVDDTDSYGHYYQWGRSTDGHQISTSSTSTTMLSGSPTEISSDDFIINNNEWLSHVDSTLWDGANSYLNPCPPGWRLPTQDEWHSLGFSNITDAFNSPLHISAAGQRKSTDASIDFDDTRGYYWTGDHKKSIEFLPSFTQQTNNTALGMSVRCVMDVSSSSTRNSSLLASEGEGFEYLGDIYEIIKYGDELWLDRNLGATQRATSISDGTGIGHYYQWGRRKDGHELPTSSDRGTVYSSYLGGDEFIVGHNNSLFEGNNSTSGDLWQEPNQRNNPCPPGWSIPSEEKWESVVATASDDRTTLFNNLYMPFAGSRTNGGITGVSNSARTSPYASSSDNGSYLEYGTNGFKKLEIERTSNWLIGMQVRCIRTKLNSTADSPLSDTPENWRNAEANDFISYDKFTYRVVADPSGANLLWLDRNLGAGRVASSETDGYAIGDYYQWGRAKNGYEKSYSNPERSIMNGYVHADDTIPQFYYGNPQWLPYVDTTLWEGVNSRANPCPSGWRLPTEAEVVNLGFTNLTDAFSSTLKIPYTGFRQQSDGKIDERQRQSYLWTSDVSSMGKGRALFINSLRYEGTDKEMVNGFPIRCVTSSTKSDRVDSRDAQQGDTFEFLGLEYGVVADANSKLWLDRNLGATSLPSLVDDTNAHGYSYQWGRRTDGHQETTSPTTSADFTSVVATNDMFSLKSSWFRSGATLSARSIWSGDDDVNNPCPPGWHVPSKAELTILSTLYPNENQAFRSPLQLPHSFVRVGSSTEHVRIELLSNALNASNKHEVLKIEAGSISFVQKDVSASAAIRCAKD